MQTKTTRRYLAGSTLVLALALLIPGTSLSQGTIDFDSATITVGRGARWIAVGDFNRDGNPDVVTMNDSDDNISVLLGNGAGGFSSQTKFPVGDGPRAAVLFGSAPIPSLAVAHRNDDTVWILPPDGQGGFRVDQAVKLTAGNNAASPNPDGPTSIVSGAFNRDNIPDLATCEIDGDTVTLILGKVDGSFDIKTTSLRVPGTPAATDADPRSISFADFNGDGNIDFVTANHDSRTIAILRGDGAGNLQAQILQLGNNPIVASTADVDKNGTQDIVVTDRTTGTLITQVGNGMGGFEFGDEYTVDPGGRPEASTQADFNGDGNVDVVVAGRDSNKVFVMLGDGKGRFSLSGQANVGRGPRAVAVVDLNKDGKQDIVVANATDGTITVLLRK